HFGHLDILINNAGVYPEVNTVDEYSVEAFDNLLKNNLRTTFLMTKYAIPHLKKSRGCIVAAGSEAGSIGIPNVTPYGGTKGFIHSFVKGVAAEQAKNGIRVNAVAPGPIDTAWTHKETSDIN
ncbi:SDR family NAD(P)-dependent oxidoreductase, partial [Salinimicrobium oceani]